MISQKTKNIAIVILCILFVTLGVLLTSNKQKTHYVEIINKHVAKEDSLKAVLAQHDSILLTLVVRTKVLSKQKVILEGELDEAVDRLYELSKPTITSKDKKDVLLWIERYNKNIK